MKEISVRILLKTLKIRARNPVVKAGFYLKYALFAQLSLAGVFHQNSSLTI